MSMIVLSFPFSGGKVSIGQIVDDEVIPKGGFPLPIHYDTSTRWGR